MTAPFHITHYLYNTLLLSLDAQAIPPLHHCTCQLIIQTHQSATAAKEVSYLLFSHPHLPPFSINLDDANPLSSALHPLSLSLHPLAARLNDPLHCKLTAHVTGYQPQPVQMELNCPAEDQAFPGEDELGLDLFELDGSYEEDSNEEAVDLTPENSGRVKAELIQLMKDPATRKSKLKEIRAKLKQAGYNVPDAKLKVLLSETCLLSDKPKGYVVRPQFLTPEEREREEKREREEEERAKKGSKKPGRKTGGKPKK